MEIKIGAKFYGAWNNIYDNPSVFEIEVIEIKGRTVTVKRTAIATVMFQSKVNGEDMVCLPYPESRRAERVFKTTIGQINKGKVYDRSFGGSPHLIYLFEKYEKMGDMKTYEIKNRLF